MKTGRENGVWTTSVDLNEVREIVQRSVREAFGLKEDEPVKVNLILPFPAEPSIPKD